MSLLTRALRIGLLLMAASCTVVASHELAERFGDEQVRARVVPTAELPSESVDYWTEVKPVLDRRCAVCHSCADAPCQLKLGSFAGLDRGASKVPVYNSARLIADDPTRLGVDARNTSEWRAKGFFPILNERAQTPEANREAGVLYRLLRLKKNNPLPDARLLPDSFDLSLDRKDECPTAAEIGRFEENHPLQGMPFALPGIPEEEFDTLERWISAGALVAEPPAVPTNVRENVKAWEKFFNGPSLKERLMSRYLYEHLFLGDLYFNEIDNTRVFKLVRSATPPGEPVSAIVTRRPTDDPGVLRPFYRLVPAEETAAAKSFLPYALNPKRMARLRSLFLSNDYTVTESPSYESESATNPFLAFRQLPVKARYRFMLDDAEFFIMGFMKGPVCRGQAALNVINDRFWVFFVDPEKDIIGGNAEFLAHHSNQLRLPGERGSTSIGLLPWREYSRAEKTYLAAKRDELKKNHFVPSLTQIWDGDGKNANAALTVFRNYDSASVIPGMIGTSPKTAWVMGYPLLERIHYLLTVEFDVFGNYGHQLLTRLYMDFMRVEGEYNFLLMLPKAERSKERDFWYRGIGAKEHEYAHDGENFDWMESGISYSTTDPKKELFEKIRARIGKALDNRYRLAVQSGPLRKIAELRGANTAFLPETSILRVKRLDGSDAVYTLLGDRAHSNVAVLYLEGMRLLPEENGMTLAPGIVGAYPNAFFVIEESELGDFADQLAALDSEAKYARLQERFGIRRTNRDFWKHADWFQAAYQRSEKTPAGLLDYSRLENR